MSEFVSEDFGIDPNFTESDSYFLIRYPKDCDLKILNGLQVNAVIKKKDSASLECDGGHFIVEIDESDTSLFRPIVFSEQSSTGGILGPKISGCISIRKELDVTLENHTAYTVNMYYVYIYINSI